MIEKMQRWTSMSLRNLELVVNSPKTTRNWLKNINAKLYKKCVACVFSLKYFHARIDLNHNMIMWLRHTTLYCPKVCVNE